MVDSIPHRILQVLQGDIQPVLRWLLVLRRVGTASRRRTILSSTVEWATNTSTTTRMTMDTTIRTTMDTTTLTTMDTIRRTMMLVIRSRIRRTRNWKLEVGLAGLLLYE